jgi:hypothetical protein
MSLHYGDPQIALGLVFAVLVLLVTRSRRGLVVRDPVHSTLEQRERSN